MNRFRHLRHFIFALLAAACLLGVQLGAVAHGITHLTEENSTSPQKHVPHAKSCDKCVVYAEVSGGAPTTSHAALSIPSQQVVNAAAPYQSLPASSPPVYSARAPPHSV